MFMKGRIKGSIPLMSTKLITIGCRRIWRILISAHTRYIFDTSTIFSIKLSVYIMLRPKGTKNKASKEIATQAIDFVSLMTEKSSSI